MSILNNTVSPAQQAASQISGIISQSYRQLVQSQNMAYQALWKNRQATPMDIAAALGTNAGSVFAFGALSGSTIASAASIGGISPPPALAIPEGYTYQANNDGSVVISFTAPVSDKKEKSAIK